MGERLGSLEAIQAELWQQLVAAATTDRNHPWRSPVLATVEGELADARTVILREADAPERRLRVYSDVRAAKVAQARQHPQGTLVMWSPALAWQLRCRVHLSVETEGLAVASRWARVKLSLAAQDYLSPVPPGADVDAATAPPSESRAYFAVVTAQVLSIDWLELHERGHRRARFEHGTGRWLQP
jgi:pyridoxamine 5'-phosphate oxidase